MRILFVCTANRCRSPMAETLAKGVGLEASSAGVMKSGFAAVDDAISVIADRGFELSGHQSRQLSPAILEDADLILCMERMHVREIAVMDRTAIPKTFTLKEFLRRAEAAPRADGQKTEDWIALLSFGRELREFIKPSNLDDIPDPIGRPRDVFVETAIELEGFVHRLARLLA